MTDAYKCIEQIKEYINNKKILEVGCGVGYFAKEASQFAKQISCIDLEDYSSQFSDFKNIKFKVMDGTNLKYKDDAYDAVVFYNSIIYFENQFEVAIREALRVTKKGGVVILASNTSYERSQMYGTFIPLLDTMDVEYITKTKHSLFITLIEPKKEIIPFHLVLKDEDSKSGENE